MPVDTEPSITNGSVPMEDTEVDPDANDAVIDENVRQILQNFDEEMADQFYSDVMQGFD